MEIVVTGATGKLGGALVRAWSGEHRVVPLGRSEADFRDVAALRERLDEVSFDAIVNAAAMANPERCEADPEGARLVNREAPGVLAELCCERGARFVHFSTDYVLDGSVPGLKDENARVDPINVYARTKRDGEEQVLERNPAALVCRVSWIFGTEPLGFIESFLARARAGEALEAVADKFSKPTWAEEIARVIAALWERPDLSGVFHLTHGGEAESWWSCGTRALTIAQQLGLLDEVPAVAQRTLAELPNLAVPRPVHTAMRPRRLNEELGWPGVNWEEAARTCFQRLLG